MSSSPKDMMDLDDDDDASIATTIEEEVDSDQEWLVNNVMAEAEIDGEVRYLIDWHGFPLHEASWEPEENLGEDLLRAWKQSKSMQGAEKESSRAISRWRQAVISRLSDRMARHKERNRKRQQRGIPITKTIDVLMSNSLKYLESMPRGDEDEADAASRPMQTTDTPQPKGLESQEPALPPSSSALPSSGNMKDGTQNSISQQRNGSEAGQSPTKTLPKKPPPPLRNGAEARQSPAKTLPKKPPAPLATASTPKETLRRQEDTSPMVQSPTLLKKFTKQSKVSKGTKENHVANATKQKHASKSTKDNHVGKVTKETQAIKHSSSSTAKQSATGTAAGPSTVRKNSIPEGDTGNVFVGGTTRKKRTNLMEAAVDSTRQPQLLKARHVRQLEKGFRDREGATAPARRPSGLISLDPRVEAPKNNKSTLKSSADHDSDVQMASQAEPELEAQANAKSSEADPIIQASTNNPDPTLQSATSKDLEPDHDVPMVAEEEPDTREESTSGPAGDSLVQENPPRKMKKRKSVHWDDNVIVQEPMEMDPEESLFLPEPTPVLESPALKAERPEEPAPPPDDTASLSLSSSETLPVSTRKVSLEKYQRRSSSQSIVKHARFGTLYEKQLSLTFDGLPRKDANSWVSIFEDEDILTFSHTCAAGDFFVKLVDLQSSPLCKGSVTWSTDQDSIEAIAENLRLASLGALCHGTEFCVLVYPTKCEDWEAADQSIFHTATSAPLRYIIFQPNSTFTSGYLAPVTDYSKARNRDTPLDLAPKIHQHFFGFDYHSLVPVPLQSTSVHPIYLAFPISAEQDGIFLAMWLRECNSECQILPSAYAGSWHSFLKLKRGIIIVHEDAVLSIRQFPGLANLLHSSKGEVSCWVFSKSIRPWGHFPTIPEAPTKVGDVRLDPIFQSGVAVLLTPSLLLSQPEQTYNLLKWYWQNYILKKEIYRRGRLVLSAKIDDWYADLISEKAEQRRRLAREDEQHREALHEDAFRARLKTLELFRDFVQLVDDYNSPIVLAPDCIDGNDEQSLVNWFGSWTMDHLDQFKKFTVVGSSRAPLKTGRLSRMIEPPLYSTLTTGNPDEFYLKMDLKEGEKQLAVNPGASNPPTDGASEAPLEFIRDDNTQTLIDYLSHLTGKIPSQDWCPMTLYKFPVSYWNEDMPHHFGDYHQPRIKTYQACFQYFRPFPKGGLRGVSNTMVAFFYTIDGSWDPTAFPPNIMPKRRPWIALFRPANPHRFPWRHSELLIWDVTPNKKWETSKHIDEDDLIEAQRELIKFVSQNTDEKHEGKMPLTKVWYNGFNAPPTGYTHPLDVTLTYLDKFIQDMKYWLAAPEDKLPERGWKIVKPRGSVRSPSPSPQASEPMDIDFSDEMVLRMKTVFHPPRGTTRLANTKCKNRLFKEAKQASQRGKDRFEYTFRPTMEWYGHQLEEGRGFEHIKVTTWESFFHSYKIPDPKATGSGQKDRRDGH